MFWVGFASMVALPMVGIFDEKLWLPLHLVSAVVFFGGFMFYGILLSHHLHDNKDKFPAEEQASIAKIYGSVTGMVLIMAGFGISAILWGPRGINALFEWALVLYFVNFFSIASFVNPFYDSVHKPGTPTK